MKFFRKFPGLEQNQLYFLGESLDIGKFPQIRTSKVGEYAHCANDRSLL